VADRNSFFRPGSRNLDRGVYKNNPLTGCFTLPRRFNACNLFKQNNFPVATVNVDASSFNPAGRHFNGNRHVRSSAQLIDLSPRAPGSGNGLIPSPARRAQF
jgi:hypothetical protein